MSVELTARKVETWIVGTEIPGPSEDELPPIPVEIQIDNIHQMYQGDAVRAIVQIMNRFKIARVDTKLGNENVYYEAFNQYGVIECGRVISIN